MNATLLKEARLKRNMTLHDMARAIGYKSPSGYWYLERGKVRATDETILAIQKALSLSVRQVYAIFFAK